MINRVVLVGRITKDPELRKTSSGISTVSFTVACNRRFSKDQTDFINCVAWRQSADFLANYVRKGALIGVEGSIQTRNYENQQGQRVYVTEVLAENVQILESKNSQRVAANDYAPQDFGASNTFANNSYSNQNTGFANNNGYASDAQRDFEENFVGETLDIASDDLPF